MRECNDMTTAKKIYSLFEDKLNEFGYVGLRTWGDPGGISKSDTYLVQHDERALFCTKVEWGQSRTLEPNRCGILMSLPKTNPNESLGQIADVVIPYEFSRRFNCRAYKEGNFIEIRSYGKYTIGRKSLKKDDFFNYICDTDIAPLRFDEEGKRYIRIMCLDNWQISKEMFGKTICNFAYIINDFKCMYRN